MEFINFFSDLSTITKTILIGCIFFLTIINLLVLSLQYKWFIKGLLLCSVQLVVFIGFFFLLYYSISIHLLVAIPSFVLSFAIFLISNAKKGNLSLSKKKKNIWSITFPLRNGKNIVMENIKRGVAIFGSAGSGKTVSCFVPIIKHAGENNIPLLNYDYKNGELTEIVNFYYKDSSIDQYTIVPHNPMLSDRVNPFAPRFIDTQPKLRQLTKLLFSNIKRSEGKNTGGNSFFDNIPEPILSGVLWRLKVDFPKFCTLPHAVAFCLNKTPQEISDFLDGNSYSKIIGTPLRDSLGSDNQVAGVKASLTRPLTELSLPSVFWILSGDDVPLDINNPDNLSVVNVLNEPNLAKVNAPFISVVIGAIINQMQYRNRPPSMLVFDEGTTFSMDNISTIPATMRSYNIATVFGTQDKALMKENYGAETSNSLLANLSYLLVGKTNDPDSVKYYKQMSEEIEKKSKSKSYKGNYLSSDMRFTESTRDTSKFKNQDFTNLNAGQFFIFSDGKQNLYNLGMYPNSPKEIMVKYHVSDKQIEDNFNKIIEEAIALE